MKIILADVQPAIVEAWRQFCGDIEGVDVHHRSILDVDCDAVVSPANSFGFMDGGIDMLYTLRFGWGVQKELQRIILEKHHGELVVGTAEIVETKDAKIPYVISAPTMRVPMILRDSVNPYLASRAALLLVMHGVFESGEHAGTRIGEIVKTVAFPGLGTGVGRVMPNICAHQMRRAILDTSAGQYTMPRTWAEAGERHQLLYTDSLKRLQHE